MRIYVCHRCHRILPPQERCGICGNPIQVEAPETFVGRTIGVWKLEQVIGLGAMGAVYAGSVEGRRAAIKLMVPDDEDATMVTRFIREAQLLSQLRHPHIVEGFESGTGEWGTPYFAMELLHGRTLRDEMRGRPQGMPLEEVLRHARQMAAGLLFAHERGVVHRDLKPENIFLVENAGGPPVDKILDFGLAKSVLRSREPRLTRSGIVLGTPAYLAPEQARNQDLGPWTDQYAFALLVAEMMTGRKMRQDVGLAQIVTVEIARPLPAERVASAKPPAHVVAALQRATQPDPADRFADVEDFVRALEDRPTRTRRERKVSPGAVRIEHPRVVRRRAALLVLFGLLVVAAGVAAWLLSR